LGTEISSGSISRSASRFRVPSGLVSPPMPPLPGVRSVRRYRPPRSAWKSSRERTYGPARSGLRGGTGGFARRSQPLAQFRARPTRRRKFSEERDCAGPRQNRCSLVRRTHRASLHATLSLAAPSARQDPTISDVVTAQARTPPAGGHPVARDGPTRAHHPPRGATRPDALSINLGLPERVPASTRRRIGLAGDRCARSAGAPSPVPRLRGRELLRVAGHFSSACPRIPARGQGTRGGRMPPIVRRPAGCSQSPRYRPVARRSPTISRCSRTGNWLSSPPPRTSRLASRMHSECIRLKAKMRRLNLEEPVRSICLSTVADRWRFVAVILVKAVTHGVWVVG